MTYKRHRIKILTFSLLLLWIAGDRTYAAEAETIQDSWQWLDERRTRISRNITTLGSQLDTWLAGSNIANVTNESFLRVRLNQQFGVGADYHSRLRIGGSLDLPQTEDRWKFTFESDSKELNPLQDTALGEEPAGNSVAGFNFLQRAIGKLQLSHSVGLRSYSSLDAYYRLRANIDYELPNNWGLGVRQRIWHYGNEGWGYNTHVSLRKAVSQNQILQASSEARYQQSREQIEFRQSIALHNHLSAFQTLSYEAGIYGVNRPNRRVDFYYAGAQYRRAIRDDWLFLEIIPQILVERDENWRPRPRIALNLEMLFFN